jgi:hypothetical protein
LRSWRSNRSIRPESLVETISQVASVDASSTRTISLSAISDAHTASTSASTVFSSL